MAPYVVIDGGGEGYLKLKDPTRIKSTNGKESAKLAVRVSEPREISGRVLMRDVSLKTMRAVSFSVPAQSGSTDKAAEKEFLEAKAAHYQRLIERNIPGTAWFRHQRDIIYGKTDFKPPDGDRLRRGRARGDFEQETFDLFTGGRAISENLQLDRNMLVQTPGDETVAIDSLQGITIAEMDWKALNRDAAPKTDPLAAAIPADQHALFFSSFQAMVDMGDEADANGTPVLQLFEPRAEDARTGQRYHTQLCLEVSQLSRLMGPAFVSSVAMTGSDPYLRTGSDVAVLFEARNVASLTSFIATKHAAALKNEPQAKEVKGEVAGTSYSGVVSPNRAISSYLATSGDVVIVTNSLYQLGRILAAVKGTTPSMQSLPEYTFFRTRYTRGDKDETGLLIMTDAAIRRWCSARWRIGNARRTYAAALMSELQARSFDALAKGSVKEGPLENEFKALGEVQLTSAGVQSSIYNSLDFMTPIAELNLDKVTRSEADAYTAWRNDYQQNWRKYFDPIAVRTGVTKERLSADVTVMPLIAGTEYADFTSFIQGAKIEPQAADRHAEEILNFNLAFNPAARLLDYVWSEEEETKLKHWAGQTLSIFLDDSPFWKELAGAKAEEFWNKEGARAPFAAAVSVRDEKVMKKFLAKIREKSLGFDNKAKWEDLDYNGQSYTRITPPPREGQAWREPTVFIAPLPDWLILSIDETTFKHALDRYAARKAKPGDKQPTADAAPVLGDQLALHVKKKALEALEHLSRDEHQGALQRLSWGNLPILNEWKRLYPNSDPVALHEKYWGVKLICPGGGKYVWNEKFQTMESTVFGHPAEQKMPAGDALPTPLARLLSGNFGLTFENQGLRARVVIDRK